MSDFEPRTLNFRVLATFTLIASIIVAIILLVSAAVGFADVRTRDWSIVGAIFALTLGLSTYGLMRLLLALESNTYRTREALNRIVKHLIQIDAELQQLGENVLISEEAKSITFREKDRDALRQAIEEDIVREDWEAALYLTDQMAKRFGYRQEADRLREKITDVRTREQQEKLARALARLEEMLTQHAWQEAQAMIGTIQAQFANTPEVMSLMDKLEDARRQHKKQLLQQWDQAVRRNEVDRGIATLKELDRYEYLTASEVAALEEPARGVFRAKLHNLGVQFSLLVTEKLWDQALDVAEEIVREFPNSRMAKEIQDSMDVLRDRAAVTADEPPTS